jgi:hypothetical protein
MKDAEKPYVTFSTKMMEMEIIDPSREACIITMDNDDQEISREYFGNNPRVIANKEYKKAKEELVEKVREYNTVYSIIWSKLEALLKNHREKIHNER